MGFSSAVTFGCTNFWAPFWQNTQLKLPGIREGCSPAVCSSLRVAGKVTQLPPLPQSHCFDSVASPDIPIIQLGYSAGNPIPPAELLVTEGQKEKEHR